MEELVRINKAIDYLKEKGRISNQAGIAKDLASNKSSISLALSGNEKYLTKNFLKRFSTTYEEISFEWLLEGVGQMLTKSAGKNNEIEILRSELDQVKDELELVKQKLNGVMAFFDINDISQSVRAKAAEGKKG